MLPLDLLESTWLQVATDWWLNDMYLEVPLALPINSNPGLAARPKNFSNQRGIASFLARFLMELLNYQEILDSFILPDS
ncbi:hypothetical protein PV326_014406 [Microctonus aethiopoides]|nr:hypothetical protein PV326_014406 [Microctonus aethiopoides]